MLFGNRRCQRPRMCCRFGGSLAVLLQFTPRLWFWDFPGVARGQRADRNRCQIRLAESCSRTARFSRSGSLHSPPLAAPVAKKHRLRRKGDKAPGRGLGARRFLSYPAQTPGRNRWLRAPSARRERTATERKADDAWWSFCCAELGAADRFRRCSGRIDRRVSDHRLRPAEALPSFARQTGQPCGACHTDYAGLTPYGRRFKIGGYTYGGGAYRTTLFPSSDDTASDEKKKWVPRSQ